MSDSQGGGVSQGLLPTKRGGTWGGLPGSYTRAGGLLSAEGWEDQLLHPTESEQKGFFRGQPAQRRPLFGCRDFSPAFCGPASGLPSKAQPRTAGSPGKQPGQPWSLLWTHNHPQSHEDAELGQGPSPARLGLQSPARSLHTAPSPFTPHAQRLPLRQAHLPPGSCLLWVPGHRLQSPPRNLLKHNCEHVTFLPFSGQLMPASRLCGEAAAAVAKAERATK